MPGKEKDELINKSVSRSTNMDEGVFTWIWSRLWSSCHDQKTLTENEAEEIVIGDDSSSSNGFYGATSSCVVVKSKDVKQPVTPSQVLSFPDLPKIQATVKMVSYVEVHHETYNNDDDNLVPCDQMDDINTLLHFIHFKEKFISDLRKKHSFDFVIYLPDNNDDQCDTFIKSSSSSQHPPPDLPGRLMSVYLDVSSAASLKAWSYTGQVAEEMLCIALAEVQSMYPSVAVRVTQNEVLFIGTGDGPSKALNDFINLMA